MKNCKNCNSNDFKIYPNKLCQLCLSLNAEERLRSKGKDILFTSNYLINQYVTEGKSISAIARENRSSANIIKRHLDWFLIPTRSPYEQNKVSISDDIFTKLNPSTAYLLGYIFTDGDLVQNEDNTIYLRIYSKHKHRIETVKEILNTSAKIQYRREKVYKDVVQTEMYWIHIGTPEIIKDLMGYGMVVHKHQEIKFPKIKKSLIPHFIRGCWVGSGTVSTYKGTLLSAITIGSLDFIKEIERNLNLQGLGSRNIHRISTSKKPSFLIKYATKDSEKLYDYLYPENTEINYCPRQKNKYIEFFNNRSFRPFKNG